MEKKLYETYAILLWLAIMTSILGTVCFLIKNEPQEEVITSEIHILPTIAEKSTIPVLEITTKPPIMCEWLNLEITQQEYELLCRTTYCESGNQDLQTQIMVCLTILNRVGNNKFPNTITDVVYQELNGIRVYSVTNWKGFEQYQWTEQVQKAVDVALSVNNYPKDMYYFRTLHYHTFGKPYIQSDDLWFSTEN